MRKMNFRLFFCFCLFFFISCETTSKLRNLRKNRLRTSYYCTDPKVIQSRDKTYYLGSTGEDTHFVGLTNNDEKWCILNTYHIINLNLNLFMYVFDVIKGDIQLISLNLQENDGGIAAKWKIKQEDSGVFSIRPLLNEMYAVTVNKMKKSVELKAFVKGNIDQEWIIGN